jgi:putative CocE/NonD family hydrolase
MSACTLRAAEDVDVERRSMYVPMSDGTRLGIDIFLPRELAPDARVSTWYTATRYWRGEKGKPISERQKEWIARGLAVVNADVRGTGASFGQWYIPYSPQEVKDIGFLANWIAKQPWSNGNVVMTGNSYTGTTALIGPAYGEPAVKAIAPKFSDFDLYTDLLFPGGIAAEALSLKWGQLVRELDLNHEPEGRGGSDLNGVRPVDGPDGQELLTAAVEEHKLNPRGFDQVPYLLTFKDEPIGGYGGMTLDDGSVYNHRFALERSGVPIFGWGSWLDAGIAQGLLNQFMTFQNPQLTIIGPWTHGAREDANVFNFNEELDPPAAAQDRLIDCFLSHYVTDAAHTPTVKHTLVYFTMGENKWKKTDVWPIPSTRRERYYLNADHALSANAPSSSGVDTYKVDFDASAGPANRWATQAGGPRINYGDRSQADRRLLVYTSAQLSRDLELTGQPVVTLRVASTASDGNFFVYLEDVDPNGKTTYITEGELRALHRKQSSEPPPYRTTYPYRSFHKKDAQPLIPGQVATLTFQLQATSVLLRASHRIRIAIAGADQGTFLRIPPIAQGDVTLRVSRGGNEPSFIDLPIVPAGASE